MGFYEQIAPYYDYIFPTSQELLQLIREAAGVPPKKLLDVACASGSYALELARSGYDVSATDIDEEMVRIAKKRSIEQNAIIKVFQADMLQIGEIAKERYNCIFCVGNSIVHVGNREEVSRVVLQMKGLLEEDGSLILQIINFDRVFKKGITSLPTITNSEMKLEFHRNYRLDEQTGLINFDTVLLIGKDGKGVRYENSIKLFPLLFLELKNILENAGFKKLKFFGGFDMEPYVDDESFLLVAVAK